MRSVLHEALAIRDRRMSIGRWTVLQSALAEVLDCPWWKRRRFVASRWTDDVRIEVACRILVLNEHAGSLGYIRVPRTRSWVVGECSIRDAKGRDGTSEENFASLGETTYFCRWIAAGGDADLGRYVAGHQEAKRGGRL